MTVWSATVSDVRHILVFKEYLVENFVKNGGFETGDLTDWNVEGYVDGIGSNGAFEGQHYLMISANRYSGYVWQRLPTSDMKIFGFAWRFNKTVSPMYQYGYIAFLDPAIWNWSNLLKIWIDRIVDNRLQAVIGDWQGEISAIKDEEGYYDSGWHTIIGVLKEGELFDVYLDGKWITEFEMKRYLGIAIGAFGSTTSIISGVFNFDDIIVG